MVTVKTDLEVANGHDEPNVMKLDGRLVYHRRMKRHFSFLVLTGDQNAKYREDIS